MILKQTNGYLGTKNVFLLSFLFALVVLGLSFLFSGTAYANGGIGSGGGGTGGGAGGGGYNTRNGWTWAVYPVGGPGPSGGFRRDSTWPGVQATCRNANAADVMIYVIRSANTNQFMGYNFQQTLSSPFAGQIPSGNSIDGGRATSVPTQWALDAFNALPSQGVSIAGYTFGGSGGNVAWFCTGIRPPNNDPIGDARADCDAGFQGWALDADNLFAQLGVAIVIKWPSDPWGPANYTIRLTANQPIPNPPFDTGALARFGVGGNRGYTVPIPDQFKIGQPYNWMAIAANAPGTSGNPLGISIIGQGNFSCPSPFRFDVRPDIPQINDDGVVSFNARNIGNGESRYSGNVGVLFAPTVWVNGAVVFGPPGSWQPRAIIAPGNTWSATRGGVFTYRVPNLSRGDVICAMLRADPTAGVTGGAVTRGPLEAGGLNVTCLTYFAKPYFRAYGGDVVVGRGVTGQPNCAAVPGSSIRAFTREAAAGRWAGAGSQFAARATDVIDGFMSASMYSGSPASNRRAPNSLSFGNFVLDGATNAMRPINFPGERPGNDQTAYFRCIPDYSWTRDLPGADVRTGNQTLSAITVTSGTQVIYVNGDVNVTRDITINDTNWSSLRDIPRFFLVATGDINISPSVSRLDGVYVSGGKINTCDGPLRDCETKLTVNGSVIAREISLNRIVGELRNAAENEPLDAANIAEAFNLTPETLLALPQGWEDPDITPYDPLDALVGLPPVF